MMRCVDGACVSRCSIFWANGGFMGLSFTVRPGALIPRPDTEVLCERALLEAKKTRIPHGAGPMLRHRLYRGCAGKARGRYGNGVRYLLRLRRAYDRERAAQRRFPNDRAGGAFLHSVQGEFDMILSNPPYISGQEMDTLAPELSYEPRLALLGGEDGLDAYRAIAAGYREHLAPGGMLLLEVGAGQARAVRALFGGAQTETVMDYKRHRARGRRPCARAAGGAMNKACLRTGLPSLTLTLLLLTGCAAQPASANVVLDMAASPSPPPNTILVQPPAQTPAPLLPPSPSPSSVPSPSTSPTPAGAEVTIGAVGDVMAMQSQVSNARRTDGTYDFSRSFAALSPLAFGRGPDVRQF